MKRTLTISGIAVLVLALAAPLAMARPPRGAGPGGGERGGRMAQNLGLSTQQSETMQKLRELHQAEVKVTQEQLRAKHEALAKLWQGDAVDRATVVAATREISALKAQLELKRVDHLFALKSVLTPEQFKQLLDDGPGMRGMRGMRGHGMRGHGMRDGTGPGAGGGRGMGPCGGGGGPDGAGPVPDDAEDL